MAQKRKVYETVNIDGATLTMMAAIAVDTLVIKLYAACITCLSMSRIDSQALIAPLLTHHLVIRLPLLVLISHLHIMPVQLILILIPTLVMIQTLMDIWILVGFHDFLFSRSMDFSYWRSCSLWGAVRIT